jgi:hypothetical protein
MLMDTNFDATLCAFAMPSMIASRTTLSARGESESGTDMRILPPTNACASKAVLTSVEAEGVVVTPNQLSSIDVVVLVEEISLV